MGRNITDKPTKKILSITKKNMKHDVTMRRSERTKPSFPKKDLKRSIEDELLHDHRLEQHPNDPNFMGGELHVHRHDPPSVQHNIAISPHHVIAQSISSNQNDEDVEIDTASNIAMTDPKSIPLFDSPSTRTRLALRRQVESSCEIPQTENHVFDDKPSEKISMPKRKRGQTKMRTIAIDQESRVNIQYNEFGQPIGKSSIGLSSFLGSLVREVVPVNLDDWRKLPTRIKVVLWRSIQSRYNINEDWEKDYFFKKMGKLWRSGKSRLVSKIRKASTNDEILQLKPDNIQSEDDWMDLVNMKKSASFTIKSEKFKAMKQKQLPHTSSRQGYARMAEDMKQSGSDPSSVTRVMVWSKAHKNKDGHPVNAHFVENMSLNFMSTLNSQKYVDFLNYY